MNQADEPNEGRRGHLGLSPADARVLDVLVEAGFNEDSIAHLPEQDRSRGARVLTLMGLLNDYPIEDDGEGDAEMLVHATLARIDQFEDARAVRMTVDPESAEVAGGRRFRLPDFVSVAAVLLVSAGVLFPIVNHVRGWSVDLRCASSMRQAGQAFGQYAGDNRGSLPMAMAGLGPSWDRARHTRNLDPLVDGGYCETACLCCPGLDHPGPDDDLDARYSYQWLAGAAQLDGGAKVTVIVGDRNPLIDAFRSGVLHQHALTISLAHGGRGQNVLLDDGSTRWLDSPVLGPGDNIWLPAGLAEIKPGAKTDSREDVFLAQ